MALDLSQLDFINSLALALVLLVGLPHGAFDGAIARYLGYGKGWYGFTIFIGLYIGLAAGVVAIWIWQPGFALGTFLIISAAHFGFGDSTASNSLARLVQIIAHGGVVVFGISQFHLDQVIPIFAVLTNGEVAIAVILTEFFSLLFLPIAAFYLYLAIRHKIMRPRLIELALLCLLFVVTPPLVGFAFYFCIIHTGRHMQRIWHRVRSSKTSRHILGQAILFTLASWSTGCIMFLWLDSGNISHDLLQIVFIGLAALTVPHMILVDGLFRRGEYKSTI